MRRRANSCVAAWRSVLIELSLGGATSPIDYISACQMDFVSKSWRRMDGMWCKLNHPRGWDCDFFSRTLCSSVERRACANSFVSQSSIFFVGDILGPTSDGPFTVFVLNQDVTSAPRWSLSHHLLLLRTRRPGVRIPPGAPYNQ